MGPVINERTKLPLSLVITLVGGLVMALLAWANLSARVSSLETSQDNNKESLRRIENKVDSLPSAILQLMERR